MEGGGGGSESNALEDQVSEGTRAFDQRQSARAHAAVMFLFFCASPVVQKVKKMAFLSDFAKQFQLQ